jgi:thymine-DNA glycosylase
LQAFKFTGSKRSRSTEPDANAPRNSPQILRPNVASPALPSLGASPVNNRPDSSFLSQKLAAKDDSKSKDTNTPPIGVPNELLGDLPLRLIIVGHNPSEIAWKRGHYYANPTNWMWRILKDTNLAPIDIISGCNDDFKMPGSIGIGFTDVGSGTPGTDSNQFKSKHFEEWRQPFYDRLTAQMERASENGVEKCSCGTCGAPVVVAFSGKKQFSELFRNPSSFPGRSKRKNTSIPMDNSTFSKDKKQEEAKETNVRTQSVRPTSIPLGRQSVLPLGWPLPLNSTEVWVMTSTSGAAAMTKEARYGVWMKLAERLEKEPWPLNRKKNCGFDGGS